MFLVTSLPYLYIHVHVGAKEYLEESDEQREQQTAEDTSQEPSANNKMANGRKRKAQPQQTGKVYMYTCTCTNLYR